MTIETPAPAVEEGLTARQVLTQAAPGVTAVLAHLRHLSRLTRWDPAEAQAAGQLLAAVAQWAFATHREETVAVAELGTIELAAGPVTYDLQARAGDVIATADHSHSWACLPGPAADAFRCWLPLGAQTLRWLALDEILTVASLSAGPLVLLARDHRPAGIDDTTGEL